jgi:uncharacterized circularly permuted ATP-grasp superfamily protein
MTDPRILDGYGPVPLDEAIDATGAVREPYRAIMAALGEIGPDRLAERCDLMEKYRADEGIVFTAQFDDGLREHVLPLDPVPRLIGKSSWSHLARGAEQRARALNAFLADVYGDTGTPGVIDAVVDKIIPEALIRGVPGYRAAAVGLAPGNRPRATVLGLDLLTDSAGRWVVLEDNLQVPSGLGYALANRRSAASFFPELHDAAAGLRSPANIGRQLHRALRQAAPPNCPRAAPQVVVLSDGPGNSAWYEHQLLSAEMGVPVVHPDDLVRNGNGVAARTEHGLLDIDVVYRRLGNDELLSETEPGVLLCNASRAGSVAIANVPGNGVADDKAIYAFVRPMIRYYLDEEPQLDDVGTWVLADPAQYEAVRGRMHELVVKPVDGSGGEGVEIGPDLSRSEVLELEASVARAPHRFIAQDIIRISTHPTFVDGRLRPRHVDLRLFVLSGTQTVAVEAALTRVALEDQGLLVNSSQGGGSKDTWLQR